MSPGRQELLEELRPAEFSVAYRMLGSVAEAEDVVQESLLRVDHALTGGERIGSDRAYIVTIATRLAIDELRSARVRRERYVGEWTAGLRSPGVRLRLAPGAGRGSRANTSAAPRAAIAEWSRTFRGRACLRGRSSDKPRLASDYLG